MLSNLPIELSELILNQLVNKTIDDIDGTIDNTIEESIKSTDAALAVNTDFNRILASKEHFWEMKCKSKGFRKHREGATWYTTFKWGVRQHVAWSSPTLPMIPTHDFISIANTHDDRSPHYLNRYGDFDLEDIVTTNDGNHLLLRHVLKPALTTSGEARHTSTLEVVSVFKLHSQSGTMRYHRQLEMSTSTGVFFQERNKIIVSPDSKFFAYYDILTKYIHVHSIKDDSFHVFTRPEIDHISYFITFGNSSDTLITNSTCVFLSTLLCTKSLLTLPVFVLCPYTYFMSISKRCCLGIHKCGT